MLPKGFAVLVVALAASAAQAAPNASCDEMVARLDAFLKVHKGVTGALPQTVGAQLMHQPTRQSVAQAKQESREHVVALLARAKAQQSAGEAQKCRATLAEVEWMLQP
jgi:hypothetical protein